MTTHDPRSTTHYPELVRPDDRPNPPGGTYDLVVVGGGTAGLVSAVGAAGLGARVALVERALLGGDCLNVGCVPSKALLRSARAVHDVAAAASVGVVTGPAVVDFAAVMERMRDVRGRIAHNDSAQRLRSLGIDVYFGSAQFSGRRTVRVDGRELRFRRAVIATGGRPTVPPVAGLADGPYLTNETVFELTELPRRLLIIGAGPIGCELAQAFALFGASVTVVDVADRPLPNEDPDASAIVERRLRADGVHFALGAPIQRLGPPPSHTGTSVPIVAEWLHAGSRHSIEVDAVLVAAGRTPNIEGLNLDAAGIRASPDGIVVNERLQTTNRRVYAAGDVAVRWKFTHAADATARMVLRNAFFFGRGRATDLVIPWCTYTIPEVAHVGLTPGDIDARRAETITIPFEDVDRAVLDADTDGFLRVHHDAGRVLGCTIVGARAGELIAHIAHLMKIGGSLGDLAEAVVPYPTYAEALRKAGDAYQRTRLTPTVRRIFSQYFRLARRF